MPTYVMNEPRPIFTALFCFHVLYGMLTEEQKGWEQGYYIHICVHSYVLDYESVVHTYTNVMCHCSCTAGIFKFKLIITFVY